MTNKVNLTKDNLTYLFKPVENKVPCGGFNYVGGGVIGKDFIVDPFTENFEGYYNLDDCVEVKSTTNLMRCDNLKFALHLQGKTCSSILKYSIMSDRQILELQIKMMQDNCVVWNAIDYLNFLGSAYNVKCIGMGFDPVSAFLFNQVQDLLEDFSAIRLFEISDSQIRSTPVTTKNVLIKTKEVPQDETDPGLYFTPTGATYIFTKE